LKIFHIHIDISLFVAKSKFKLFC